MKKKTVILEGHYVLCLCSDGMTEQNPCSGFLVPFFPFDTTWEQQINAARKEKKEENNAHLWGLCAAQPPQVCYFILLTVHLGQPEIQKPGRGRARKNTDLEVLVV